jgi:N-acetylglucosamine kinase-like BadF-type ATPase
LKVNLLIESGSTKADWIFYSDSEILFEISTIGLNPKVISKDDFNAIIKNVFAQYSGPTDKIHFYGSGVLGKEKYVASFFTSYSDRIEIFSDLIAASRASFQNSERLVCILGTGSYLGKFSGEQLLETRLGHGYIIGDICGGSEFGKILLKDYLNDNLPKSLGRGIEKSKEQVISTIYKSTNPNRALAAYFPLIVKHRQSEYCQEVIKTQISQLFDYGIRDLLSEETKKISFIGGVGYHLKEELNTYLDLSIEFEFIDKPIAELLIYHQNNL